MHCGHCTVGNQSVLCMRFVQSMVVTGRHTLVGAQCGVCAVRRVRPAQFITDSQCMYSPRYVRLMVSLCVVSLLCTVGTSGLWLRSSMVLWMIWPELTSDDDVVEATVR